MHSFSNRRPIKVCLICVWPDWASAGTAHVVGEVGLLVLVVCVDLGYWQAEHLVCCSSHLLCCSDVFGHFQLMHGG